MPKRKRSSSGNAVVSTPPVQAGSNWSALQKTIGAGKSFKAKQKRAAVTQDIKRAAADSTADSTPTSADHSLTKAVGLDCEMVGVGPNGRRSALARVSVVNSLGNVLYDTHVAVAEPVTDYRTFVSGVRWYDLKGAPAFDHVRAQVARVLQGRLLVGHTLRSDLAALGMTHPGRDTRDLATYAPLQGAGKTKGLKVLAAEVLGIDFQTGEHSSVEDARISMYIYLRHRKQWEKDLVFSHRRVKNKAKAPHSQDRKVVGKPAAALGGVAPRVG
mmetsp:Transcript_21979/g.41930  ORF Transcript_21979/g.41930 Transcript_21979/m.41930 type:complete len:272 (-) Transcript_21979:83-898(-)